MSDSIDIGKIHPELEPIKSAPAMFSFYGFGTRLIGERDFSQESQSVVKTLCLTLLFFPVYALSAYRVHQQGDRFYFLGKVPVSSFARNAGRALLLFVVATVLLRGVFNHFNSDDYRNGKVIAQAETAFDNGEITQAMTLYKQVANDSYTHREKAKQGIRNIFKPGVLQNLPSSDLSTILEQVNSFKDSPLQSNTDDVFALLSTRISDKNAKDTVGVHKLLHATRNFKPQGEQFKERDLELIQAITQSSPTNLDAAVELGEYYYAQEDLAAAKSALAPVADQLGSQEGARILGQIYISEGNNKAAYPLLSEYTKVHLEKLQASEKKLTRYQDTMWDIELNNLNRNLAPQSFYDTYDSKSEEEQQTYVNEYIGEKINSSDAFQKLLNQYREDSAIVPVVMDFGILQLRNAESMNSLEERNAELTAAEKTFLSIRSSLGDTDEYRIYLGQVYFWLGKQDEGQQLFDDMLNTNSRSANSLVSVAYVLRTLGKVGMAATLAEEAYEKATTDSERYSSANLMHYLSNSIEDEITWLSRSDPSSPSVQASLKDNSAKLAEQKGNSKNAASLYKEAIAHSESLPENASNYNNTALIYFSLHRVSGDQSAYKKGVELMSKAVELRPDESILLSNSASTLVTNALYETLGNSLDYTYLKTQPRLSTMSYYYKNAQERESFKNKTSAHQDFKQAIEHYQRSTLLSPNNASNYRQLYTIYYFLKDENALADLSEKITRSQVDLSAINKNILEYINENDSSKTISSIKDGQNFSLKLLKSGNNSQLNKAYLNDSVAEAYIKLAELGELSAANKAVQYAKKAVQSQTSSETRETLTEALLALASIQAAEKYPDYKAIRSRSIKTTTDAMLITLALNQDNEMATWLKSNSNVKQAMQIQENSLQNFPDTTSPFAWALLKQSSPNAADNIVKNINKTKLRQVSQTLNEQLNPLSGGTIINDYWLRQMSRQAKISQSKFEDLNAKGLHLPVEYMQ